METITVSQQEIINAICIQMANQKEAKPEEVIVELVYDDDLGYSAEVELRGRQYILIEAKLVEAIRDYLQMEYQMDPFSASLKLDVNDEEGIFAVVTGNRMY